jgi:hypothetical protein
MRVDWETVVLTTAMPTLLVGASMRQPIAAHPADVADFGAGHLARSIGPDVVDESRGVCRG